MTSDFAPEIAKYPKSILPQQQFWECASLLFRSVSDAGCLECISIQRARQRTMPCVVLRWTITGFCGNATLQVGYTQWTSACTHSELCVQQARWDLRCWMRKVADIDWKHNSSVTSKHSGSTWLTACTGNWQDIHSS